jgi:flagellar biosynthesis protein FliQ
VNKIGRVISNAVYVIGAIMVLYFGFTALFGSNEVMNPESMLPFTYKERAVFLLMFGSVPMLIACSAVCIFNGIEKTAHKKRNIILIYLPGLICAAAAVFIIGFLCIGWVLYGFGIWK